jgi:2-hydroxychromene-2-carboxylate isomerase
VVYPKKGCNMWRDVERRAEKYGLAFHRPDPSDPRNFPAHSVLAARIALVGLDEGWGKQFCRNVYVAQFAKGEDVSDSDTLTRLAKGAGAKGDIVARATTPDNKLRLRTQTEEAFAANIYGAPSFTVGEELFWGDDRLEDALDWALR